MKTYPKSAALQERAARVLAGGVSSEFRKFNRPHPLVYERGEGSRIQDVDGNTYLDFTLSQGPLILGHSPPQVLEHVATHSAHGQLFAGQHLLEIELAERLQRLIPCAQLMRFSLSGSEADHMALRLARAATGRPKFLRFEGHYHGWFDNVAQGISAPDAAALGSRENPNLLPWTKGLPPRVADECVVLPWNDLDLVRKTLEQRAHEIAALITEPVMCNNGCVPPQPGFLQGLRELCDRHGIVLIFDEVITGFRLGMSGAQGYFKVIPDLAIFGKAMANGYPISVLAGKRTLMQLVADGTAIHAGTMNSGQPSIAAAVATLDTLEHGKVHERLFRLGQLLMDGLRRVSDAAGKRMLVQGMGPMFHAGFTPLQAVRDFRETLSYDKALYAQFVQAMQDRGVRLIGRGLWYISAAHTEADVNQGVETAREALKEL